MRVGACVGVGVYVFRRWRRDGDAGKAKRERRNFERDAREE